MDNAMMETAAWLGLIAGYVGLFGLYVYVWFKYGGKK